MACKSFAKPPCLFYYHNMTPQKRELIQRVIDGDLRLLPLMHQLDGFTHSMRMFTWLNQNKIVGVELYALWTLNFKSSWLGLGKWVVMMINKDNQIRKVIAGKDYISK